MSTFLGADPERLAVLLRALSIHLAHPAPGAPDDPLGVGAVLDVRRGLTHLAELMPALRAVTAAVADPGRTVSRLGPAPVFALPGRWRVTTAPRATPAGLDGGVGAGADAVVLDLLGTVTDDRAMADRARLDALATRVAVVLGDPIGRRRFLDGLGPVNTAMILERLHARTDVTVARPVVAAVIGALAAAVAARLADRPETAAAWEEALVDQGPSVTARVLAAAPAAWPDAVLARLAHAVLSDPTPPLAGHHGYPHDDADTVAAVLAPRPLLARSVLAGVDEGARRRLLERPSDGSVGELLVVAADPATLPVTAAPAVVGPWFDTLRRHPDRIAPATAARLGDMVGPWLVALAHGTTAPGNRPAPPFATADGALVTELVAAAARSHDAAVDLAAWLTVRTIDDARHLPDDPEDRRAALLALGFAGNATASGIVAGRAAWADRRARDRALVTGIVTAPIDAVVDRIPVPAADIPGVGAAVGWVKGRLTDDVAGRLTEAFGFGTDAADRQVVTDAEADRERTMVELSTVALAAGGVVPAAVLAAARHAPDRLAADRVVRAWSDGADPDRPDDDRRRAAADLDAYRAGWSLCDQRVCR